MENKTATAKKALIDLDPINSMRFNWDLTELTSQFFMAIFRVSKDYGVDELEVMKLVSHVLSHSADDPKFKDEIAPSIWRLIEIEENEQED